MIIDFGQAKTAHEALVQELPESPLERHWSSPRGLAVEQLGPSWWFSTEKRQEWLKKEFGEEKAKYYQLMNVRKLR